MKKSLIALLALSGLAMGELATGSGAFQLNRGNTPADVEGVESITWNFDNTAAGSGNSGKTEVLTPLKDGTTITMKWTDGKNGMWPEEAKAWSNTQALGEMNADMKLNLTLEDVSALASMGAWAQSGNTTMTLTFSKNIVGAEATFYVFSSSYNGQATGFGVTGMSNTTITHASPSGDGFDGQYGAAQALTLFKVVGTLTDTAVVFSNSTNKNGWSMAAYTYTLTQTYVTDATMELNGVDVSLKLTIAHDLEDVTGDFNVMVGDAAWQQILNGMGDTGLGSLATVTLVGMDGVELVLGADSGVTLNGYTGETNGKYVVAYIPEPATATLSLLALAGLAARHRRK